MTSALYHQAQGKAINYHIVATIKMLESLPWPKHLKRVPEYAGGHHERMDGKGYPKGLKRESSLALVGELDYSALVRHFFRKPLWRP